MKTISISIPKYLRLGLVLAFAVLLLTSSRATAQTGEENFKTLCASCHRTDYTKAVGPGLAGIKEKRGEEWLRKWIVNSKALIATGDAAANQVYAQFNEIDMPGFPQLDDAQLTDLIAYIDAEGAKAGPPPVAAAAPAGGGGAAPAGPNVADPLRTLLSDITTWAIFALILLSFIAYKLGKYAKEQREGRGQYDLPHAPRYLGLHFTFLLVVASCIVWLLVNAFATGSPMLNNLMFSAFPYLAVVIFLIGTIRRYSKRGFTVSSLSSQFLEGKQLFWGSQPFHWGIMFLFFGHLIAFLFPRALMAWNGMPVRLLILEVSSFVFGLSALVGICTLIYRRFASGKLIVVGSKADMLVYVTLLTQILSGLGVAFFVRWGSTWFAAVLTPYMRSLFMLNPDIEAVSAMPWVVKIHIISAFFIIAIIPYTRFMHFLVAPVAYLWRSYQVVVWNYSHKDIRNSSRHTFGKKSRNH
jgi:nitrate reductase gamma subunit